MPNDELDLLRKQNSELVTALKEAIELIELWHGMMEPADIRDGTWKIYLGSPEMRRILLPLRKL